MNFNIPSRGLSKYIGIAIFAYLFISFLNDFLAIHAPSIGSQKRANELRYEYQQSKNTEVESSLSELAGLEDKTAYNELKAYYLQEMFAVAKTSKGSPNSIEALLHSGIDINTQDEQGRTILFYATAQKNAYLVRYLLGQGADRNIKDYLGLKPADLLDKQKDHALYLSFYNQDVTQKAGADGLTNIQTTVSYDENNKIIKTEVIGEQRSTWSPLMLAIESGSTQEALEYIDNKQYLNHKTNNGSTAIFLAIKYNEDEVMDALLRQGADIQHRNRFNMNPLALAIYLDNRYAVKQLVKYGVDIRSICTAGSTPVQYAVDNRRKEIKEYLKSVGAS